MDSVRAVLSSSLLLDTQSCVHDYIFVWLFDQFGNLYTDIKSRPMTRLTRNRVVRGSGWKRIGAYVNLGSYYLVGILVAIILGFLLNLRGQGLWGGLVSGTTVQSILLSLITSLTNFGEQAMKTRQRMVVEKLDTRTKLLE
ncbi:hypothetical protein Leryth_024684 [Lithospermum erythrorhizon]|nr:hypothetical protein Leryth_024684 [Lithospermum erythrorhizon]